MDWSPHISAPEQVTYSAMIALRRVLCVVWTRSCAADNSVGSVESSSFTGLPLKK